MSRDPSFCEASLSNSAEISNASGAPVVSDAFVDDSLELIMRAAGSSLRHYMPSSKDDLRKALRGVLASVQGAQS